MSIIYKGTVFLSVPDSAKFNTPHQVSSKLWINAKLHEQLVGQYDETTIDNIIKCEYNRKHFDCEYDLHLKKSLNLPQ